MRFPDANQERLSDAKPLQSSPTVRDRVEEEESWVTSVLAGVASFVAGGRQCCSMRDRTISEAAKKASETGRPPERPDANETPRDAQAFPAPKGRNDGAEDSHQSTGAQAAARRENGAGVADQRGRPAVDSGPVGQRSDSPPEDSHLDVTKVVARQPQPAPPPVNSAPAPPPKREADNSAQEAAPAGHLSKRWEWPPWCLNFKQPSIEVYVLDDEAPPGAEQGRWVHGEPQSRVVDKSGVDAYLCVEYEWDDEYYVQDFGPQHVRRRGQHMTVYAIFDKVSDGVSETTSENGGRSDFTRPKGPGDSGKGVSDWLDDTK